MSGAATNGEGRIVVVGASLAGRRAAEAVRATGFSGGLTLIDAEPYEPYDRPPLSKQVLTGWVPADHTALPRLRPIDAELKLGVAATGLDRVERVVELADGERVGFDLLLIATGTRATPWPNEAEASLDGVFTLHGRDDAAALRERLAAEPRRVLVIGGGFTGSEVASVCRGLGLEVTLVERAATPLAAALGEVVGAIAADMQRAEGVDLRTETTVARLEGDAEGRLRRAVLSDGSELDVDLAVVALGATRNTEWLAGSGLAVSAWGVACDAGCRAFDRNGIVTDTVFVAGDIARFPHPLYEYQLLALEHWGNAVEQAAVAGHNMASPGSQRRPHLPIPSFWSIQFGVNIKSVGLPPFGEELLFTQGSVEERSFAAAYGRGGRIVAAVTFNHAKWLDFYARLIAEAAPFPPPAAAYDVPAAEPVAAGFPHPDTPSHTATIALTGHAPSERGVIVRPPPETSVA